MKRITITATAVLLALGACGDGNPFFAPETTPVTTTPTTTSNIPADVAGSVANVSFDPTANTLSITGLLRDGNVITQTYNRNAALDAAAGSGVYQAYTFQDDPLDEHTTVYVRRLGDVEGSVAVTGGQFQFFSGGVAYKRDGGFDPIVPDATNDRGLVTYAGEYIGLSDLNGPDTDLLTVPGGTSPSITPSQAAPVTGDVFINVEFGSTNVAGTVYNRVIDTEALGQVALPDLILAPTNFSTDGSFTGGTNRDDVSGGNSVPVGDYGGIIGGPDSNVVTGGLYAVEHFGSDTGTALDTVTDEEEYGIFVLGRCGSALQDATATDCASVDPE
ncbi:MAG: thymidylate synthase [Paracoccaceae bacterium]